MKKTIFYLLSLLLLTACNQASAPADSQQQADSLMAEPAAFYDTKPSQAPNSLEIPKYLQGSEGKILRRVGYTCSYNARNRIPNWVAWHLTANHVSGHNKRNNEVFHEDTEVSNPRAYDSDYRGSGYDRGHMCPSGDNKWSQRAQEESFLMTNICPQNGKLNGGDWNDLEVLCRTWAKRYDRVYIVCGPVLRGDSHKTIGRQRSRRITVPEAFYKVVLRTGKNPAAIGFIYDNNGSSQPMHQAVRSVDEIEQITGLDFFSSLPDDVEHSIESKSSFADW